MRTKRRQEKHPLRMVALISQIGITMMVAIFLCAWIGAYVSKITGMELLFVGFLLIGIFAGFRSCFRIISRFVSFSNPSNTENVSDAGQGAAQAHLTEHVGENDEDEEDRTLDTDDE